MQRNPVVATMTAAALVLLIVVASLFFEKNRELDAGNTQLEAPMRRRLNDTKDLQARAGIHCEKLRSLRARASTLRCREAHAESPRGRSPGSRLAWVAECSNNRPARAP